MGEFGATCWGRSRRGVNSVPTFEFGLIEVSEEEQQIRTGFAEVARPIMQANCATGGCHSNVSWHSSLGDARATAALISSRINLNDGQQGKMPRSRNWNNDTDKDELQAWLDLVLN